MRFRPAFLVLSICAIVVLLSGLQTPGQRAAAADGNTIVAVDTSENVGASTSIELDAAGNPVVSYRDISNNYLKLLHCGDPTCTSGNTITTPDTTGTVSGSPTSLELDAAGNPIVSYFDLNNGDLKLLHCGDPACGAGNTIATREADGNAGIGSSLALDADGNPIVSYRDITNGDLRVLHCTDPACLGGNTITSPAMMNLGMTSLALDAGGNAVVSYTVNGELQVIHCGNPSCSANNIIASPDPEIASGQYRSLALSASGNPIVSYEDLTHNDLRVLHCGNPTCTAGNIITSPDTEGAVGHYNSLRLDPDGNPVISYHDITNRDLKILHCGNPTCSAGNTISSPDTTDDTGRATSVTVDADGNAVVSYYDLTNGDLNILHCGDVACSGEKPPTPVPTPLPVGGIAELPDVARTPLDASSPSGAGAALLAGIAVAAAAGAGVLGGAAWFARRRR